MIAVLEVISFVLGASGYALLWNAVGWKVSTGVLLVVLSSKADSTIKNIKDSRE